MDIEKLLDEKGGIRLDIACGRNKQEGFVGLDIDPTTDAEIIHDAESIPWPLPDECVLVAVCSHYLEHVNPHRFTFIKVMDEIWRVLKVGAELAVTVPHGSSQGYIQDPTHCNQINETTWAYFDPEEPNTGGMLWQFYRPKPWRLKYLSWSPTGNIEVVLVKRADNLGYYKEQNGNE